jgi:hypothetical protein
MTSSNKPILSTYVFSRTLKVIILTLFLSCIPLVFLNPPIVVLEIFALILGTIGAITIMLLGEKQEFYEDSIELYKGRTLKTSLAYSAVVKVRYWGKKIGKTDNYQFLITVEVDGRKRDLRIFSNIVNRKQKMDLLNWLKSKVPNMMESAISN